MKRFVSFLKASKLNNPNVIFSIFLIGFVIDSVVNFFVHMPILVPVMILMLPVVWLLSWDFKKSILFAATSLVFILSAIAHNLIFGLHRNNISDLVFILVCIAIYNYYSMNSASLERKPLQVFSILIALMFSFTFLNVDSGNWKINKPLYEDDVEHFEQLLSAAMDKQQKPKDTAATNQIIDTIAPVQGETAKTPDDPLFVRDRSAPDAPLPQIHQPEKPTDVLEYFRTYRNGFLRLPHIAAYFFGFLLLWFGFRYSITKQPWLLALSGVLLFMMLLTGVRTVLVVLVISLLMYVFLKYKLSLKIGILVFVVLVFLSRNYLYAVFEDTFLSPYFSMLITFTENFSRFSRILIWKSWYHEISNFDFIDFLTGKSFHSSFKANTRNLFFAEWFHNDFMSIVYSYGLLSLAAFIWFFIRIYRDHSMTIRNNPFVFIFYASMVITSFINGFYYFHPVFLFFIFMLMSREVRDSSKTPDISRPLG